MLRRLALATAAAVLCAACIETAVSAEERMVHACDDLAEALEAESERGRLDALKEATHWADLAARKDRQLDPAFDAFTRLVEEGEEDPQDRDAFEEEQALRQVMDHCDSFASTDVRQRIRATVE